MIGIFFQSFTLIDLVALALFLGMVTFGVTLLYQSSQLYKKSEEDGGGDPGLGNPPHPRLGNIQLDFIYARKKGIPVCRFCETLNSPGAIQCCACRKRL